MDGTTYQYTESRIGVYAVFDGFEWEDLLHVVRDRDLPPVRASAEIVLLLRLRQVGFR
jgi:hypothetical protein